MDFFASCYQEHYQNEKVQGKYTVVKKKYIIWKINPICIDSYGIRTILWFSNECWALSINICSRSFLITDIRVSLHPYMILVYGSQQIWLVPFKTRPEVLYKQAKVTLDSLARSILAQKLVWPTTVGDLGTSENYNYFHVQDIWRRVYKGR